MEPGSPPTTGVWLEQEDGACIPVVRNCMFGRSRSSTVVIPSSKASRSHATIHIQDSGEFWLIDLGSINGTFLNGSRVARPERLRNGDRILVADMGFTFHQADDLGEESMGESLATIVEVRSENRWLMLADIEGFTPLSQRLEATELATVVGTWVRSGREIIGRKGGTINKYMGDGYLVCWPSLPETPARVAAAMREFQALREASDPKFRIIFHHGMISFGGLAAGYGEESLMGAELNFIFRVEKVASELGVAFCFTAAAKAALGELLPLEEIPGDHALKGFAGSSKFFKL
ncbi:MAG: adenylate/guanylate cyclase domain-containing protein [Chthoniobacteraceae bacterium]